jgi:hypothetical protein
MGWVIAVILIGDTLIIGGSGCGSGSGYVAVADSDWVCQSEHFDRRQSGNRQWLGGSGNGTTIHQ